MKVWVLLYYVDLGSHILGVYSSLEKAEIARVAEKQRRRERYGVEDNLEIHEHEVDE